MLRLAMALAFALALPAQAQQQPVAAFQGGGPLRGVAEKIAPPPYVLKWKFDAGGDEGRASIDSNPVIAGDTAYVTDSQGGLYALNLDTGLPRWTYKSPSGFATSPLILNNMVYAGDLEGIMHAVSADKGEKVWSFDSGGNIHSSANLTPDHKALIFGNDSAQVFALDAVSGKKLWEGKGGDRINACPGVGFGAALFTGCDARLLGLDLATGQEKFALDLGGLAPGSPAVTEDRIIIGTGEGTVIAVSSDGKRIVWKYELPADATGMFYSSPAVDQGIVVIGCQDRQVHAINLESGKGLWKFKTRGDVDAAPVISDGRVYVGSKDRKFYVLDLKTGNKLWEAAASRAIAAGPAVGKGRIVFGDTAGHVYCYEPGSK